jgi:lipid-A-disaccharide synthase-like uncharacterized protein
MIEGHGRGRSLLVCLLIFLSLGLGRGEVSSPPDWENLGAVWNEEAAEWETVGLLRVNLPGARNQVELLRKEEDVFAYRIRRTGTGQDRLLTPEEFHKVLARERPGLFWLWRFLNISGVAGLLWVGLGLLGQVLFAGRMVVQWIISERERRSVVPVIFWWMSLAGASMLLLYFVWRRDVIGVLGQAMGWVIYVRNLCLIYGTPAPPPGRNDPASSPEPP